MSFYLHNICPTSYSPELSYGSQYFDTVHPPFPQLDSLVKCEAQTPELEPLIYLGSQHFDSVHSPFPQFDSLAKSEEQIPLLEPHVDSLASKYLISYSAWPLIPPGPQHFDNIHLPFFQLHNFAQYPENHTPQIKKITGVVRKTKTNLSRMKIPYSRSRRSVYRKTQRLEKIDLSDVAMDENRTRPANNDLPINAAAAEEIPSDRSSIPVRANVKTYTVSRNSKGKENNFHIEAADTQNALLIESNCDFYDTDGNFILGVRFNMQEIEELLPKSVNFTIRTNHVAAAGFPTALDIDRIRRSATTEIVYTKFNSCFFNGRNEYASFNYIPYFRTYKTLSLLPSLKESSLLKFKQTHTPRLIPIINKLSQAFKEHWPRVYEKHDDNMSAKKCNNYYVDKSVFSTLDVTHHLIENDEVTKNARYAYHKCKEYRLDSCSVFYCSTENVTGGHLFFPDLDGVCKENAFFQGICIKTTGQALVCFNNHALQHGVTSIGQADGTGKASRVTFFANMRKGLKGKVDRASEELYFQNVSA